MTLQFPNNPSNGQQYTASNNLIYTWDGEKWITTGSSGATSGYVLKIGDNMTGDLTLGTDKITLAADGSSTLKARCTVGTSSLNNYGISVYNNTSGTTSTIYANNYGTGRLFEVRSSNDPKFIVDNDGTVYLGGNPAVSSPLHTIELNADGSAEFLGGLTKLQLNGSVRSIVHGLAFDGTNVTGGQGVFLAGAGANGLASSFRRNTTGDQPVINIGTSSNPASISLNADGSATFAGFIKCSNQIRCDRTSGAAFAAFDTSGGGVGTRKVLINVDGSAEFAGPVAATIVPPSDARFKENITPANPQLADVVALGGLLKNYDWNADAPVNEALRAQRQLGLIAQEAEVVCPSITKTINRTKQGAMLMPEEVIPAVTEQTVDDEGVTTTVVVTPEEIIPATYEELDDSYKGISTDVLIMKLLGAVSELKTEIDALRAVSLR